MVGNHTLPSAADGHWSTSEVYYCILAFNSSYFPTTVLAQSDGVALVATCRTTSCPFLISKLVLDTKL